ncbi:Rhomboid- protein 3 [Tritrichomonas musculus]|uniref:Rhomboid- protein 3 n=1 Tax=Tritrichomonas musculus TaxID=1915356 RepID=A0ABR2JKU0_9EUKA
MDFDEQQKQLLYEVFSKFDCEKEGYLNETELRNLLVEFEIDQSFAPSMLRIFAGTNKSRSNSIDYEFSSSGSDYQIDSSSLDSNASDSSSNSDSSISYVSFEDIIEFFKVIITGDTQQFYQMLFAAIDSNNDSRINKNDLVEFSRLFGDELSEEAAAKIITDCEPDINGSIQFDNFWSLYSKPESFTRNNSFENLLVNNNGNDNGPVPVVA